MRCASLARHLFGRRLFARRLFARRLAATTALTSALTCAGLVPAYAAGADAASADPLFWTSVAGLGIAAVLGTLALRTALGLRQARRTAAAAEDTAAHASRAAARARLEAHAFKLLLADGADGALVWTDPDETPEAFGLAPQDRAALIGPEGEAAIAGLLARLKAGEGAATAQVKGPDGGIVSLAGRSAHGAGILLVAAAKVGAAPRPSAEGLAALLDAAATPAWLRTPDGTLSYANSAFLSAVGTASLEDARRDGLDLLDGRTAQRPQPENGVVRERVRSVAGGKRRQLDVVEVEGAFGTAGLAIDTTAVETAVAETQRIVAAHRDTLDQLATAVVIFGADERLVFHNAAYERLFDLSPAFLAQRPSDSEVLEVLRTTRKVPEQANFARWRAGLRKAYHSLKPVNDWWHLPGGQMLRVVITPNAEGGVTYLFDDLSEHVALEARYNTLIRIQGETLDGLAEAVAVFGSDGRLNLYNPSFLDLWSLSPQVLGERPHVDAVAALCRPLYGETEAFARIRRVVTAIERREAQHLRLERADGRVLDGTAQPLPDGGTMVTFRDITDSVRVERALTERAEALEASDKLKNAFVRHVSYHLRTPLNTLMGYADLLREGLAGPLSARQQGVLDHMQQSSDQLRALIDDILDLASVEANAVSLDLAEVDVGEIAEGVADAVRDQLEAAHAHLVLQVADDAGRFTADGRRVRQILFNLLANAIAVSPEGGTVTLGAERRADALVFTVRDEGPGIPAEVKDSLFERFESRSAGLRHGGVGLGLAIVRSFMELHGGTVSLATLSTGGTGVSGTGVSGALATCIFPLTDAAQREAAE